MMIYND